MVDCKIVLMCLKLRRLHLLCLELMLRRHGGLGGAKLLLMLMLMMLLQILQALLRRLTAELVC